MRINGWMDRAAALCFYQPMTSPGPVLSTIYLKLLGRAEVPGWVFTSLAIHLFFAVTTSLLWIWVIAGPRRFRIPPCRPSIARATNSGLGRGPRYGHDRRHGLDLLHPGVRD